MRSGLSWERGRPARSGPKAHQCSSGQACPRMGEAGDARDPRGTPALPASADRVESPGETQNENYWTPTTTVVRVAIVQ